MLQDSPQSTAQLLNQVHMMSHITFCPLIHPLHSLLKKVLVLGDVIQPALVYPVHCLVSSLVCPLVWLSSPLYSCLVLGACYVIHPVDFFPSSVQHYCTLINANLHQSTTLEIASYKVRKRFLHEYWHSQIHSTMKQYYYASKDR